jgi:hypothetical protein
LLVWGGGGPPRFYFNFFQKNFKTQKNKNGDFWGVFGLFFEIHIIKLPTSRPRHFLGPDL